MNLFRTIRHNLASRRARERRRARWNEKWAGAGDEFLPPWLERDIPVELRDEFEAVQLDASVTALDVGCGQGAIARWLAERGADVVGVDLAESVVRAARKRHADGPSRLQFLAADFCREFLPYDGSFRLVVDRGCFHGVPVYDQEAYVKTLATVTQEGSDYFLFVRVFRGEEPIDRKAEQDAETARIRSCFERCFHIEHSHITAMGNSGGKELPGLFFRMKRNGRRR